MGLVSCKLTILESLYHSCGGESTIHQSEPFSFLFLEDGAFVENEKTFNRIDRGAETLILQKLILFLFSLGIAARDFLENLPPRSWLGQFNLLALWIALQYSMFWEILISL